MKREDLTAQESGELMDLLKASAKIAKSIFIAKASMLASTGDEAASAGIGGTPAFSPGAPL